jgi:two-component system, OmpR family, phosphate regulon sensor histidine kinase PhoR
MQETQRVIDGLNDAIVIYDKTKTIIFANQAAKELFTQSLLGSPLKEVIVDAAFNEKLDTLEGGKTSLYLALKDSHSLFHRFNVEVAELKEKQQTLLHFKDMTKEAQLERMRADFVANASHELRTPLASLAGFIETLQTSAKDDPPARDMFLNIMREQAQRMTRLIDDLLSLSKIEMTQNLFPQEAVKLFPLIDHTIDTLKSLAKENNVVIKFSKKTTHNLILGDRDELIRLFENLIENAIKYGFSGKKVDISADKENNFLILTVRDYGQGVPKEYLARLTERFYRVDVTESRSKGGTGLGLALVKHIVAHHRGTLSFASEEGQGLEVKIILPLVE